MTDLTGSKSRGHILFNLRPELPGIGKERIDHELEDWRGFQVWKGRVGIGWMHGLEQKERRGLYGW